MTMAVKDVNGNITNNMEEVLKFLEKSCMRLYSDQVGLEVSGEKNYSWSILKNITCRGFV